MRARLELGFAAPAAALLLAGCAGTARAERPRDDARPAPERAIPATLATGGRDAPRASASRHSRAKTDPAAQDPTPPRRARTSRPAPGEPAWGTGDAHSYLIPAAEIVAFEFLLNQVDRHFAADDYHYETDWESFADNLHRGWVMDRDPFGVNQLGHPYSGALYHNFARSTGHEYWAALAYTFAGSLLWETAGEVTPPSLNDQIATGFGGTFLGEALFRSASWVLEQPDPNAAEVLGAALLSPPLAFNRLAFDRFDNVYPSLEPAVRMHVGGGVRTTTFVADGGRTGTEERDDGAAEYAIEYGLPGLQGYAYDRPFDYFQFELRGMSDPDNHVPHLRTRGLLVGAPYEHASLDGVYGLYGVYDYLSPGIFRVANTALAFGTTAQLRLSQTLALQGTLLAGAGFGAAGTVADDLEDRDYHYGAIPQALADLSLVLGDVAVLEWSARDYLVVGAGSDAGYGAENIVQSDIAVMLRVVGGHALRVEYVASARDTHFSTALDEHQSIGSLTVGYAWLGATRWGAVE